MASNKPPSLPPHPYLSLPPANPHAHRNKQLSSEKLCLQGLGRHLKRKDEGVVHVPLTWPGFMRASWAMPEITDIQQKGYFLMFIPVNYKHKKCWIIENRNFVKKKHTQHKQTLISSFLSDFFFLPPTSGLVLLCQRSVMVWIAHLALHVQNSKKCKKLNTNTSSPNNTQAAAKASDQRT